MLASWASRVPTRALFACRRLLPHHGFFLSPPILTSSVSVGSAPKVSGCREAWWLISCHRIHHQSNAVFEEYVDPFSLVENELSMIADKLKSMVITEVPELSSATEYFFKSGVEGKKIRMIILILLAKTFNLHLSDASLQFGDLAATKLGERQRLMAGVAEIIHVASLMHDDVLDEASTRRGIGSLNFVKGNKLAVLAGDFMLSRAIVALASLKNTEAVSLMATVISNLITGETMQMKATYNKIYSMEFYMQKTYNKTASLISNSCKAIAVLSGQPSEVATLAFEYGKNLGLAYQLIDDVLDFTGSQATLGKPSLSDIRNGIITAPVLFAIEEFPGLQEVINRGFNNPANLDTALEYIRKSRGIQRTRELAMEHSESAMAALNSLPETFDEDAIKTRQALINLTQMTLAREK